MSTPGNQASLSVWKCQCRSNEQAVTEIEQELRNHKTRATKAQTFYREKLQ